MVFGLSFGGSKNKYSQTTNESGNFENTYNRAPVTPENWQNTYDQSLQTYSAGGHQAALGAQAQQQAGAGAAGVGRLNETYLPHLMNQNANTIATLERDHPDLYQKAPDVTAANIDATRGIDYSDPYVNKYLNDVVDTSLNDYDVGVDRQQNAARARQAGAGAFGTRSHIYNAIADAEAARGRGSLAAGLRYQAQDRAFGLGQQDAGRQFDANRQNVANQMAAQQFNAQRNDQRTMFDVNEAMRRDQFRAGVADQMAGNILSGANLNLQGTQLGMQGGQMDFDNLFNILGLGTSTFGEEGTEAGVYDSTNSTRGKGTGFNAGVSVT